MSRPCARCGGDINPGTKRNRRYCDPCQPAAIAETRGKRHDANADALPPGEWRYDRRTGVMRYHATDADTCRRGHEFTPDNTRVKADGRRRCRTCERAADNRRAAA